MSSPISNFKSWSNLVQEKKTSLLNLADHTPCYVYDESEAIKNLSRFNAAFKDNVSLYYAIKTNFYPGLLKTVANHGSYLDASSQREFRLAKEANPKKILITGPAKKKEFLEEILTYEGEVLIHLESIRELKLLSGLLADTNRIQRCGVRIYTKAQSNWSKFGIPLHELNDFIAEASLHKNISLEGIQFHISFNSNSKGYVSSIKDVTEYLKNNVSPEYLDKLTFLDIGGGFVPEAFEGIYPWNKNLHIQFSYKDGLLDKILNLPQEKRCIPYNKVEPIELMAKRITNTFKEFNKIAPNAKLFAEPGRFICHSAMHHLMKVIEVKPDRRCIITDAGNNMLGWEKQQWVDYTPLFNLTQFSDTEEIPLIVYGNLCTSNDIWGYYLYSSGEVKEGDILCMPFQGAYTYGTAQEFIVGVPEVVKLREDTE